MDNLFSAFAASFLEWPLLIRALITGCFLFIIAWPITAVVMKYLLYYGMIAADRIMIMLYWIFTNSIISLLQKAYSNNIVVSRHICNIHNAISCFCEKTDEKIRLFAPKVKKYKKTHMSKSVLIFTVLYIIILIPSVFHKIINPLYYEAVYMPQSVYMRIERLFLGNTDAVVPLFSNNKIADKQKVVVTFDTNDGALLGSIEVDQNGKILEPKDPKKTNYSFSGWYQTGTCTGRAWLFQSDTVADDITLYAKWVSNTPTSIQVESLSYNSVTINWDAIPNVDGYEIFLCNESDGTSQSIGETQKTSFTHEKLITGNTYNYMIKSYCIKGSDRQYSQGSSVVVATPALSVPSGLSAVRVNASRIDLSYHAVQGATHYEIWRSLSKDGKYTLLYTTTELSYRNLKLTKGTTYFYKVRALLVNKSKKIYSEFSPIASAEP